MAKKAKNTGKKNNSAKHKKNNWRRRFYDADANYERDLDKLTELKTPVLFSELSDEQKKETLERLGELIDDFFEYTEYLPGDDDRKGILNQLCEEISESLNVWEPEPYDPVKEYYDPRFDFGSNVRIDEKIAGTKALLDADADDFDPYAEPEEPAREPQKELIADN